MTKAATLLKRWRLERGLTQAGAAERVGLRQHDWSRLETGERMPLADEAVRIERATRGFVPFASWASTLPRTGTDS